MVAIPRALLIHRTRIPESSSGNDRHDSNVDNVPMLPVASGVPPPIPVVNVGQNGDEDQVVPNLNNGGGDPDCILVYIDGLHVDDFPPQVTETFHSIWLRLARRMYYQTNGIRMRAI